ncbi:hypothetical protein CR513_22336, partial [Mucuna pruriens]
MDNKPFFPLSNYLSFHNFSSIHKTFLTNLNSIPLMQAMDTKMEALKKNKTWELVFLPKGKKHARMVAKGFMQTYGIDFKKPLL